MIAVIDIGSNSVRMLLKGKTKEKLSVITKLIENCKDNLLDGAAIERSVKEVVKFIKMAQDYDADIHIFATECLRNAKNSEEFTNKIFDKTGYSIKILSKDEESTLAFLGAGCGKMGELAVLDIGGGSTELAYGRGKKISITKSLPIGAVRLYDRCKKDRNVLEVEIKNHIKNFKRAAYTTLIGVGGTITSLAALDLNLKKYDADKVNGHVLKQDGVRKMFETLITLNDKQTLKLYGIQKGREKTIAGGCLLLLKIMELLKATKITVSESDNLEGFIIFNEIER